jgi:hypothetical protein
MMLRKGTSICHRLLHTKYFIIFLQFLTFPRARKSLSWKADNFLLTQKLPN